MQQEKDDHTLNKYLRQMVQRNQFQVKEGIYTEKSQLVSVERKINEPSLPHTEGL